MKDRTGWVLMILCLMLQARVEAADTTDLVLTEFMASNSTTLADGNGDYSDWIEIHNPTSNELSLDGCYLSDDPTAPTKWAFPAYPASRIPAMGFTIVFASGNAETDPPSVDPLGYLHASFRLSAGGESIVLTDSGGSRVLSAYLDFPPQEEDVSYGLASDGATIGFFSQPSPGAANGDAVERKVADTKFSVGRGFFSDPILVEITTDTPDATIRYTLDGSTPTSATGTLYTGPIQISTTTVLRARAEKPGYSATNVDTQTYLFVTDIIHQPASAPGTGWPTPTNSTGPPPFGGTSTQRMDYEMDPQVTGDSRYSGLIDDALLSLPSVSIVTDLPNLFDPAIGIYSNPEENGREWERPASIEFIYPEGAEGFQVDAGLRIRGGVSTSKTNPKHSFRVILRSEYGDSKIEFPLFGEEGPRSFDKIDFRTAQNFSWNFNYPQNATWLDDPFSRDTMRDMGHVHTDGFFFHLYLDGIYWGLYQIEERPDAQFGESYLGGSAEDYDVLKSDDQTGAMYALDGTMDLYRNFWTEVDAGVESAEDYYRLQGMNPDGTPNPTYPKYLDVNNLVDYMLIVFYTGALDMPLGPPNRNSKPRNLYTLANRIDLSGFKFLPHDNEWSLMQQSGVYVNRVNAAFDSSLGAQEFFNPWWLHQVLIANEEYLTRFADRVHKHFFNNGALSPEACTARYQARIDEIHLAIIAESARWGDTLSSNFPRTRDNDWIPAVSWVRDFFMNAAPQTRTEVVLGQLRNGGLYPNVAAPQLSQFGGDVDAGFVLTITAPAGPLYFTTDGSDPRLVGGEPSATAGTGPSGVSVEILSSLTVKSRAYRGGTWSALAEADFQVLSNTPTPNPTAASNPSETPTPSATSDLNQDGTTDSKDLLLLLVTLRTGQDSSHLTIHQEPDGAEVFLFAEAWNP